MIKKIIQISSITSVILMTGCSLKENPMGVGFEHSACESSAGLGVCGRPIDIYKNRDKINDLQSMYLKSGIDTELFFGISNKGEILVKSERTGKWEPYQGSRWQKEITEKVEKRADRFNPDVQNNIFSSQSANQVNLDTAVSSSKPVSTSTVVVSKLSQDIVVTKANDLSVTYNEIGSIPESRTKVGNIIREREKVQKVWYAPYEDDKGDFHLATESLIVVEAPAWIVGEKFPDSSNINSGKEIPTPFSKSILGEQPKYNEKEDLVIKSYENGDSRNLQKALNELSKEPKKEDMKQVDNLIDNYLNKK